jgi:hypothetical protein
MWRVSVLLSAEKVVVPDSKENNVANAANRSHPVWTGKNGIAERSALPAMQQCKTHDPSSWLWPRLTLPLVARITFIFDGSSRSFHRKDRVKTKPAPSLYQDTKEKEMLGGDKKLRGDKKLE